MIYAIIIFLICAILIFVLQYYNYIERKDLLNRLYSKDYVEYKAFENVEKPKKIEEKDTKRKEVNWL